MPTGATEDGEGCAFILDRCGPGAAGSCNQTRQPGSAYCPAHHARCHLANGSLDEGRRLREIEALAKAVGGKQGRSGRQPPDALLDRLEQATRVASRAYRSRIVRKVEPWPRDDDTTAPTRPRRARHHSQNAGSTGR